MAVHLAALAVFHILPRENRCNMTSRNKVINANTGPTMNKNTIR